MIEEMRKDILRLLAANGRMSHKDIAERLNASEADVAQIIKKLEENHVIMGYCAMIDDSVLPEKAVKAIIEVKVRPERDGGFDKIAKRLSRFPQVSNLYLMSGGYDLMIEVDGENLNEAAMFVASKLSTIDGVLSTATHFLLKKYKVSGKLLLEEEKHERLKVVP